MQCVCVRTCACAECGGVYKKVLLWYFDTQKAATCWNKRVSYWNRLLCLSRKVIHGKGKTWHAQKQQNRCGIVWVETVKIRWLAMKLKVAHMDAGGRKWCAKRQQSRIMQMLGNKLPVKHKKRSDFSIASMSGWEDSNFRPLEPHSSTLPNCATPSHVPKVSTLAEGVNLANRTNYSMFPAPCQEGKCLFLWFFAKSLHSSA